MTRLAHVFAFVLSVAFLACNQASMSGDSARRVDQADGTAKPGKEDDPEELGKSEPGKKDDDDDGDVGDEDDENEPDLGTNGDENVKPDEVVDGMELITDCDRCVARAKQLSKTIGFTADKSKTYNLGFYKVDPSRGICDIHFMQDMSVRIGDHEGKNSVLDRQVAFYCPCNCGWASTSPFGSLFP